jgi:hypothetical protein
MEGKINGDRRRFLGAAAMTIAGGRFGAISFGNGAVQLPEDECANRWCAGFLIPCTEANRRRRPERRIRRRRSFRRSSRGSSPRVAL